MTAIEVYDLAVKMAVTIARAKRVAKAVAR